MTRFRSLSPARFLLLACAVLAAAGCSINPATGERQLALVSEAQEAQLGLEADREITASLGLYPDDELQRYVSTLGRELAARSERPDLAWEFKVVDDPIVNAFALPGGYIYITRGILAHMGSEAELAGVLGHEIGHVTARHGVEQLSRAQLATLGLGVAMVAGGESVQQWGGLAQAGLGLLFLKFGRDDERQSDDLGMRYLLRAGFDPHEMPQTFRTLERVSAAQGAGRIPDFLSTHPNPGSRVERLEALAAGLPPEQRSGTVNREQYMDHLQGLIYGPNPREGFFKDTAFYHPDLAFQLDFPAGWKTSNQRQAVVAVSPRQDAQIVLALAQDQSSPQEALDAFFRRNQGLERGQAWRTGFYHFRTHPDQVAQGGQNLRGILGFFRHQGQVFLFAGLTAYEGWSGQERAITASLGSFRPLTNSRYLNAQPQRIEIVRLPRAMTLREFSERYASAVELPTLAILNGAQPETRFEAGQRLKRVVGELP